ncbi:MAG: hypothetical protein JEZ09_00500 [Salinivirgaceae bacterium]|nr:hypothetical protein [Salinivirgaceae bacterium]
MKRIIKYNIIPVLFFAFGFIACNEDFTDDSTLNPKDVTVTVTSDLPTSSITEADAKYTITATLNAVQLVNVKLNITQTAGDATSADFSYPSSITIQAGSLSATDIVEIKADDIFEAPESFTLQVGDAETANANFTPVTFTVTIKNATSSLIAIDFSWETNVYDVVGIDLDATDVVDMRFLVVDPADSSIIVALDGSGFESYGRMDSLDDGDYLLAADIFSTINAGDFNAAITIDAAIEINQSGVIFGEMFDFPALMTNSKSCSLYRSYMLEVNKAGDVYTFVKEVTNVKPSDREDLLIGNWAGIDIDDESGYHNYVTNEVYTRMESETLQIIGIGFGWMTNFWGEEIIDTSYVNMIVDWENGTLTIPEQEYMITFYDGAEQDPYSISGTGTFDNLCSDPTFVIKYDLIQAGTSWAGWCAANGYLSTDLFEAYLTLGASKSVVVNTNRNKFDTKNVKPKF